MIVGPILALILVAAVLALTWLVDRLDTHLNGLREMYAEPESQRAPESLWPDAEHHPSSAELLAMTKDEAERREWL